MKRIENFAIKKAYENGYSHEECDLRWEICGVGLDILRNINEVKDKIDADNKTEIKFINKGTRKPTTRGERYEATKKAKENALHKSRHTRKGSYVPIYRGEHGETKMKAMPISEWLQEGDKAFWKHVPAAKRTGNRQRYDWKKEFRRLRRHEGKNLCFNYEAEDATEMEDIWMIPDEGWLEDYPEEAERMEELEKQERIEWMQYLEDMEEESDKKQNLYEYYLDPGPEIWNEEEGRYYEGKPIPSGQAALEWIREHNLIDELERWVKEKIGEI